jgi:hypothetical protein
MMVRISHAGQHRLPGEIYHPRGLANVPLHVTIRSHKENAIAFDGDRFCLWPGVVDRVDVAVFENKVGWLDFRGSSREQNCGDGRDT